MELKKSSLEAFEAAGTITLTQEESMETIVPDFCPDIARIIQTEGKIYLHNRQIRDGKAELSGTIRISVLYTPDGEKGLRTLEFALPFGMESERGIFPKCSNLEAEMEVAALETRMMNPRKVFSRCKLVGRVTGYQKTQLTFASDIDAQPELAIEKRQIKDSIILLSSIGEKDFSFTDELTLSAGKDGAAELLSSNVCPVITDTKSVGNKLIFKGMFHIRILYRDTSGKCTATEAELPFSQVMETADQSEDTGAEVYLQLTGSDFQISSEMTDGRLISATLYLRASAFFYRKCEAVLLEDLYSTVYNTSYEASPVEWVSFRDVLQRRQTVREILEIGVVAESILSLNVQCASVSVEKTDQSTVLRAPVTIRVLYQDEGGAVLFAERSTEAICHLEISADCKVTADAVCVGEVQGSIGERGIEVRFPVDFVVRMEGTSRRLCISSVQIDNEMNKDHAPSLVLRRLGKEEKLWNLAKQYHTTVNAILAANNADNEDQLSYDKMLLIPKKRT